MATNLNRVIITGNLTRDPELRELPSGTSVCQLRVAVNERVKDRATDQWTDRANYFDVTVWGPQGENCHKFLSKGRGVAVDGRLRWREWESDAGKRQAVDIIAESVQFLGGGENPNGSAQRSSTTDSNVPADTSEFSQALPGADDIPF